MNSKNQNFIIACIAIFLGFLSGVIIMIITVIAVISTILIIQIAINYLITKTLNHFMLIKMVRKSLHLKFLNQLQKYYLKLV